LRIKLEEGAINISIQAGIGVTFSKEDLKDKEGLEVISLTIRDLKYNLYRVIGKINSLTGPTYVSIDIEVADPAFTQVLER